ncbi:DNA polymerase, beta-like region [Methanospirillum hungatei JF-1]|uniref:protein adenylyltransferase n=2 Tax=Methanospirillum hungatei TaxID=2203 RepID=Q2FT26_METHJ|nr:DNA polymerase, beta-like region [Methanospirillum hungatei JF-1]
MSGVFRGEISLSPVYVIWQTTLAHISCFPKWRINMTLIHRPIIPDGLPITEDQITDFCTRHHISTFSFFGSASTGTLRPDSDIDIMITYESGFHPDLFTYHEMIEEMEKIFERKVDIADRKQVEAGENYIRRIGMLNNLKPTYRQISHLLDILLYIRSIERVYVNNEEENAPDSVSRRLIHDGLVYQVIRLSRIAQLVSPEMRMTLPTIPWDELDQIADMDLLDEPDSELIREILSRLRESVTDLQNRIPDEETFIRKVEEQGYWSENGE